MGAGEDPGASGAPEREELQWRRVIRLRGPMTVEVSAGEAVVGRIWPAGKLGTVYGAEAEDGRWTFRAHGFRRRTLTAHEGESVESTAVVTGRRIRYRRWEIRLAAGPAFEIRQTGFTGTRHDLFRVYGGPRILRLRNAGGPLRWRGSIEPGPGAAELGDHLPLLALFTLFHLFQSSDEVHFG